MAVASSAGLEVGPYTVTFLDMGDIWLDGGAMFGVVPKPMWSKTFIPDERNRIQLACRGLLLRGGDRTIVVDTGAGARWTDKERSRFGLADRDVRDAVAEHGVSLSAVTDVILTHLHFDHAGGAVDERGLPSFSQAQYWVQKEALAWARNPSERDAGSFRTEDFEPLVQAGRLSTLSVEESPFPEIQFRISHGHTQGLQIPVIADQLVYPADIVPTSAHLRPSWVMAYDLHPAQTTVEKRALLTEAIEKKWQLVYEHDPVTAISAVDIKDSRFVPVAA